MAAATDTLGRVMLLDVASVTVVRLWKVLPCVPFPAPPADFSWRPTSHGGKLLMVVCHMQPAPHGASAFAACASACLLMCIQLVRACAVGLQGRTVRLAGAATAAAPRSGGCGCRSTASRSTSSRQQYQQPGSGALRQARQAGTLTPACGCRGEAHV